MMPSTTSPPADRPRSAVAAEPTHPCVRCGRPVAIEVALCEFCNPLELAQPAASQAHGTAFIGVAAAVLFLAVAARFALSGAGPFEGAVSGVNAATGGLSVTVTVTNQGTGAGQATCRIARTGDRGVGPSAVVTSPRIEGGATLSFSATVTQLGGDRVDPGALVAECRGR